MRVQDHHFIAPFAAAILFLAVLPLGCKQKWDTTQQPLRDEEVEAAFFSGLDAEAIPDVPEPKRLRPCCIFGNDIGAQLGRIKVPGYEIQYSLDISELGTPIQQGGGVAATARRRTHPLR